jgi:hypothetical protein
MVSSDNQFHAARLKIKWAKKHIDDLTLAISRLAKAYYARQYSDGYTKFIEYGLRNYRDLVDDLALVIGDAIHNLKCALDYAWIGAIVKHGLEPIHNDKFPVYPTCDDVKRALEKRKIPETSSLYDLIFTDIKPYSGGNDAIRSIHALNRRDKHSLLVPLLHVAFLHDMEVKNNRGEIDTHTFAMTQPGRNKFVIPKGSKLKKKGKISVLVVFDQGVPSHEMNVLSVLTEFRQATISVVELLQSA